MKQADVGFREMIDGKTKGKVVITVWCRLRLLSSVEIFQVFHRFESFFGASFGQL